MIRQKIDGLKEWTNAFLRDCKTRGLSSFTIDYYRAQLTIFITFCESNNVLEVTDITADLLRSYLIKLESEGHNAGGRHAKYRPVRVFLNWWEQEAEPEAWTSPLAKVKPPKMTQEIIQAVSLDEIKKLIAVCDDNFTGIRDKAIILCLLDTGARVREFLNVNLDDVDFIGGGMVIRKSKSKPRVVFIGKRSRKALRAYLRLRQDDTPALWATRSGERLAVKSLQSMLERRAKMAGIPTPSPHDFRRAFALEMLRNGADVFTLQRLMGHSTLDVLKRYLAQTDDDAQKAHALHSPVDRL